MEMVPKKLQMIIVYGGNGATPAPGQFLTVRQFTYLENMSLIRKERTTPQYRRGKVMTGLDICLGFCREGFKGRFFIDGSLAYAKDQPKISKIQSIVIDL